MGHDDKKGEPSLALRLAMLAASMETTIHETNCAVFIEGTPPLRTQISWIREAVAALELAPSAALTREEAAEAAKAIRSGMNPATPAMFFPQGWNVILDKLDAIAIGAPTSSERAQLAPPTEAEISAYRDLFRSELDKRMDTKHPSASPSTEAHGVALRNFVNTRKSAPSATSLSNDAARLLWLETTLQHCPHAELTHNDDADEGPVGWSLVIESCSRMDLKAPSLTALIDLGMSTEADEDGNVVARSEGRGANG